MATTAYVVPRPGKKGTTYRVRWRDPRAPSKWKQKTVATEPEADALVQMLQRAAGDPERTAIAAQGTRTVADYADQWLRDRRRDCKRGDLKRSSLVALEDAWTKHVEPRWAMTPVGDIRHQQVQRWAFDLLDEYAKSTVRRAVGVLRAILEIPRDDEVIPSNPADRVKYGRQVKREVVPLTLDEVYSLADAMAEWRRPIVVTAALAGLRWAELVGLQRRDIDFDAKRIRVRRSVTEVEGVPTPGTPKSRAGRRSVPMMPQLAAVLREHLDAHVDPEPTARVFHGPISNGYLRVGSFRPGWLKAVEETGHEGFHFHDLRHTFASMALDAGTPPAQLAQWLGHESIRITLDTYSHAFEDTGDPAVADRLGASVAARQAL